VRPSILLFCALFVATPALHRPVDGQSPRFAPDPPALAFLGTPEHIADGVDLYRIDGPLQELGPLGKSGRATALRPAPPQAGPSVSPPRSIRLLRLDPRRVRLASALATGEVPGRATVRDIAQRTGALAAVNAGFFSPTGDPNGVLKIDGRLLSDAGRFRGAVALMAGPSRDRALFDQVSARISLRIQLAGRWRTLPIDGVDTTRGAGRLVLYTPASGASTDTTGGLEWTLRPRGSALRVVEAGGGGRPGVEPQVGNATIPRDGFVLSYGGSRAPATLADLSRATSIQLRESIVVHSQTRVREWTRAATIVGGAGLLIREGRPLTDWTVERLSGGFETTPHPRTVIARDRAEMWWLITIDGRQPGRAVGMSFVEMQALLSRLNVTDALNLDGGGSTTMVVGQREVNRPSDPTGPRPVSDAIIVTAR
jgi:hypothetical protein